MKAFVDPALCIGCTQCAGLCPEVYTMEGTLAVGLPRQRHPHRRIREKHAPKAGHAVPGFFAAKKFADFPRRPLFCAILYPEKLSNGGNRHAFTGR